VADLDPDLRALQEVRDLVARAKAACEAIHHYDQARTDALCAAMAKSAANAAADLGRLAVEETGIGRVHYKVLKNLFGAEGTWASIRNEKTVGIVAKDEKNGVIEVATAAGVIAGIIPTTNPTSTAIYKALIAVKGRNAIVISPHPRARRCIGETVEVMRRAIERAGGPADLVLSLSNPTIESTGALMKHKDVALVLATGGSGLVHAAYSSGKPAYGVGPGNVPVYVDRSADVAWAAQAITSSQSFDNATLCCSEQGIVLDQPIASSFLAEMKKRGAYLCDERETERLAKLCNVRGNMNPDVVGLDAWKIAEKAGFAVPKHTTVLLANQGGVGKDWPLSIEILAPVLSVHTVDGWRAGCRTCIEMLEYGGLGHTLAIHAKDQAVLDAFFLEKPANRILVNGPASQGAVGYSTNLVPSMSLGCGPQAGNISSDNITARHLDQHQARRVLKRDWVETERRDHARAAAMLGEPSRLRAGRGSPGIRRSALRPRPALRRDPRPRASRCGATGREILRCPRALPLPRARPRRSRRCGRRPRLLRSRGRAGSRPPCSRGRRRRSSGRSPRRAPHRARLVRARLIRARMSAPRSPRTRSRRSCSTREPAVRSARARAARTTRSRPAPARRDRSPRDSTDERFFRWQTA
jgi:acyl-CoA reductase-like NAD-dependent aldehyde dehydrogenase